MVKAMKQWKRIIAMGLLLLMIMSTLIVQPTEAKAYKVADNMQWWYQDRFGLFIHLGAYAQYGQGEWAMSEQKMSKKKYQETIAAKFNPASFDAKEIAQTARKAGMKYIVITAKHHEGLAMWDTKVAGFKDYTGTRQFSLQQYTPFGASGRDLLMELKNACAQEGLKFGLYYSIIDWNHSSQTFNNTFTHIKSMEARDAYIRDMKAQLQELVTTYDPDVMWFDGDWTYKKNKPTLDAWWTKQDGVDLYNFMKQLKPSMLVNERVCRRFDLGDFECPEQTVPVQKLSRPWETCQTMNGAWGYKKSQEKSYKSSRSMIQELVTVVSRDGNYLLNIGPKGDGTMTAGSKKILKAYGKWMEKNSDSIYGTTGSPFKKEPAWGRYTRKENTVYAHVFKWPSGKKLTLTALKNRKVQGVTLLGSDRTLKYTVKKGRITVTLPKKAPDACDTVIAVLYQYKN